MPRGRGETVEPQEQANEYIEILDKHSYNEVVLCELNDKKMCLREIQAYES